MINKRSHFTVCLLLAVLALMPGHAGAAEPGALRLHGIFGSNMVLQRDQPILIWGWAAPGRAIAVQFGEEKAEATAAAGTGRWEVTLPARPAQATAQKLTVVCGDEKIELENLLIGDVWVMNGQSNMGFGLGKVLEADMEMAAAHRPLLRCADLEANESEHVETDLPADKFKGWIVSTPETAGEVSAIGHVFGSRLQQALQIPIGILNTSRGGASIESLVPRHKFQDDPLAAAYLASVEKRQAAFSWDLEMQKLAAKWEKDVAEQRKKGVAEDKLPPKPTRKDVRSWNVPGRSPSDAAACYNGMFGVFKGLRIKGVLFHQGYNNAIGEHSRPRRYRVLMRLMVEGWREDFQDPQLPVGVIEFCAGGDAQTPDNFEALDGDPASFIREAQRQGLADVKEQKNTAFISGYDEQIPGLHPVKKQVHGIRAARWALSQIYGLKIDWGAASLVSARPDGDTMVLTFDKPVMPDTLSIVPEGFAIAGEDGKFYRAHAAFELIKEAGVRAMAGRSHDAKKIYVWSPLVKTPVAVRYAWARSPMGNLKVNGKPWLPLHSFRTDTWDWPETDDPATNALTGAQMKEREKEAAARCEYRRTEEARQAVEILQRRKSLGAAPAKAPQGGPSMARGFVNGLALLLPLLCGGAVGCATAARPPDRPNILLILADDLGYGDVGCYNDRARVATPNLDRLAREGLRFTDAHSPATVCTPTRYSLMTGQMAFRVPRGDTVFTDVGGPSLIAPGRLTLPALLRAQGYTTACVGKWHIGLTFFDQAGRPVAGHGVEAVRRVDFSRRIEGGPVDQGFDTFFGTACCPTTDWLYAFIEKDRVPVPPTHRIDRSTLPAHPYAEDCREGLIAPGFPMEEVDLVFLNKSRTFLERHARETPERPFVLFHSAQAVHLPSFPAPRFRGATQAGPHGDFIHQLDWVVGELLAALEQFGFAENTLVLFTSDNGPEVTSVVRMRADYGHDGARPWRGMKRDNWEGGHRVPLLVRWPGQVKAGATCAQLASLTDVMATIAAIVGADLPRDAAEDSFNLLPALRGEASGPIRPYLLTQGFEGARTLAIRRGPWKYLDHPGSGGNRYETHPGLQPFLIPDTAPGQLYQLDADPGETRNLYFQHPEIVQELKALLEQTKASGRSRTREEQDPKT